MLGAHIAKGLVPGSRKRGRPSKNRVVDPNAPCVPCPGKDGKGCVEAIKHGPDMIPYVYEGSVCCCCDPETKRGRSYRSQAQVDVTRKKRAVAALKEEKDREEKAMRAHLREVLLLKLARRPIQYRGISDPYQVATIMGLTIEEIGEFHRLAEQADDDNKLLKLFDYLEKEDGGTFAAHNNHTARWQCYLNTGIDASGSGFDMTNPLVEKVMKGLFALQTALLKADCVKNKESGKRVRMPVPMGGSGVAFTAPTVLYSRGKEERANKDMPQECFTVQAYHTDHDAEAVKKAFGGDGVTYHPRARRTKVAYSVIINFTPGSTAVIKGCGLSHELEDGVDHERHAVDIKLGCGEMVVFRGDYVHAGSWYERNNTRVHLNLFAKDKVLEVNATHIDEQKVAPLTIANDKGMNVMGQQIGVPKRNPSKTSNKGKARK